MAKIQTDIKKKLKDSGHTMADLSAEIDVPYNSLNWYLNGMAGMPHPVFEKITNQFKKWESKNGTTPTE